MKKVEIQGYCASCKTDREINGGTEVVIPDGENPGILAMRGMCAVCGTALIVLED